MSEKFQMAVKLFRNQEEFQKLEPELDSLRAETESEIARLNQLAKDAGVPESVVKKPFNRKIDASLLYPVFLKDSADFKIWNGFNEKGEAGTSIIPWENLMGNGRFHIPPQVLEEQAWISKNHIFAGTTFNLHCPDGENGVRHYILYGKRGDERYLVAFFGDKRAYDRIQQDLQKLNEKREKEALAKQEAENKKTVETAESAGSGKKPEPATETVADKPKSDTSPALFIIIASLLICLVGVGVIVANQEGMWPFNSSAESDLREALQPVSVSESPKSRAEREMFAEHERHVRWSVSETIDELPRGIVSDKEEVKCGLCSRGKYWRLIIKPRPEDNLGSNFSYMPSVSERLYMILQKGDLVPQQE